MKVKAKLVCFIEGSRRRRNEQFELKDPKNFNARCLVQLDPATVIEEVEPIEQEARVMTQVEMLNRDRDKDPSTVRSVKPKKTGRTADDTVI